MNDRSTTDQRVLSIEGLRVALPASADRPHAIVDLSLDLLAGRTLCVVGESGSGKSITAAAIMGLLPPGVRIEAGRILLAGEDLLAATETRMQALRGARIAMVFQEPMTALNPLRTIGDQLGEVFEVHTELARGEIRDRVLGLLSEVRIPDPEGSMRAYPHELSGGQRQRAMIAMALALEPRVLIADEPTTALDVTTQAQILTLIRDLQARTGAAVLFITHDFGVVAEIADRVVVMQHGVAVESGPVAQILGAPGHPYTRELIAAVPPLKPPAAKQVSDETVLEVRGLGLSYRAKGGLLAGLGLLRRRRQAVRALDGVSLALPKGATLGIVGESGSGKSTLARCIVGLAAPDAGSVWINGIDTTALNGAERRASARQVQMVFQDPYGSLNPRRRAGDLVCQGPIAHGLPRAQARKRARELFELVGLDAAAMDRFPHEFSGGQRQRIGLARALALQPSILVADEPVSALDVSVQAQVLRLLADLKTKLGLSMLFVTHDLRVAAQICDLVAVMQSGCVVEEGPADRVLGAPRHEYTQALIAAVPGRNMTR